MTTNDNILIQMISNDLRIKSISDYQLLDEVVTNPKNIEVGANEVVYACYCYVKTTGDFKVKLTSGTDVTNYHNLNTIEKIVGSEPIYESSQITTHWSSIKITASLKGHFFIRYVKVVFSKIGNA
jgi:hypothetical protein